MYYTLQARKGKGVTLYFDGKNFSNTRAPHRFATQNEAAKIGRALQRNHSVLSGYSLSVHTSNPPRVAKDRNPKKRTRRAKSCAHAWRYYGGRMWCVRCKAEQSPNGKITPAKRRARRRNPQARELLAEASKKIEDFSGHTPRRLQHVDKKPTRVAAKIGTLDGVMYTTVRDGKVERYVHEFTKRGSKPALAVSADGRQLEILGGRYEFTEAGIEDR